MHHRDLVAGSEPLHRSHIRLADLAPRSRRRDGEPAIQQEPHDLPLGLQGRDIPRQEDAIDRIDLEGDPLPQ